MNDCLGLCKIAQYSQGRNSFFVEELGCISCVKKKKKILNIFLLVSRFLILITNLSLACTLAWP